MPLGHDTPSMHLCLSQRMYINFSHDSDEDDDDDDGDIPGCIDGCSIELYDDTSQLLESLS